MPPQCLEAPGFKGTQPTQAGDLDFGRGQKKHEMIATEMSEREEGTKEVRGQVATHTCHAHPF